MKTQSAIRVFIGSIILGVFLAFPATAFSADYKVVFEKESVNLIRGRGTKCPAYVFKNGKALRSPAVSFKSSNYNIASVNSRTGYVYARRSGICKITCTYKVGGRHKASGRIVVTVKKRLKDFKKHFDYYGHRGNTDVYPENTLEGFYSALKRGCTGVECDLWVTKSGDLLICHDSNLKKLCGKNVSIRDLDSTIRFDYPLKSKDRKEYYIPTLEETLDFMHDHRGKIFLHLKKTSTMKKKDLNRIYKEIKETGMLDRVIIFAKAKRPLKYLAKKKVPPMLGRSLSPNSSFKKNLKWCKKNGVKHIFLSKTKYLNRRNINLIRRYGLRPGIYWLGNTEQILLGMDYNIDFGLLIHDNLK